MATVELNRVSTVLQRRENHRQENQKIDSNRKGSIEQPVGKGREDNKRSRSKFKNVDDKKDKRTEERGSRVKIRDSSIEDTNK